MVGEAGRCLLLPFLRSCPSLSLPLPVPSWSLPLPSPPCSGKFDEVQEVSRDAALSPSVKSQWQGPEALRLRWRSSCCSRQNVLALVP